MSGLRSAPVKGRSSPPVGASAATMMATPAASEPVDADADADANDWDDSDVFSKDESSSPDPENEKPRLAERRPPSKLSSGGRRIPSGLAGVKSSKSASKAVASASKAGIRSPPPSPSPVIPRRAEDWEPWKTILHELYITQNRILRDIINIMDTNYNLRATPKMYKNQFARWNFFKYAIKRRPRIRSDRDSDEGHDEGRDEGALVVASKSSDILDGLISPLLHESNRARVMQNGLASVRDFLLGYINIDPTARADMVVVGYQDPSFRYFTAAMDLFDQKDNDQGGLILRRAFLQLENLLSANTLKSFSDLCITIPHLLIESRRPDILTAYLRYISGLAAAKFPNHPLCGVISSFAELLDEPEAMMRYLMTLSKANSDTISDISGGKDRTRKWAHNQYLACQRTNLDLGRDASSSKHPHGMLRVESQSVYWAQHLIMNDPESDKLAELWMFRNFPGDFAPRTEAFVNKVRVLGEAGLLPPEYARMMECLYIGWLNDYYETVEDWPKVFEWARKGLLISTGEQYQVWSIHLEELQRKHGSTEEADEMRKKRLNHEFLEKIRLEVERMTLSLD
ncbi:hypothetical protein B0T14DRAFT_529509 [Immersiella caudata]|uniref:Clr5 domain-containing protein n=1 Tax=Immersiella caudata TaxID=314043 RepID=A0AA39TXE9_9PEZI|nr:hypothetical protein B0T14DRAFT_529509 [Immersiella caudata]